MLREVLTETGNHINLGLSLNHSVLKGKKSRRLHGVEYTVPETSVRVQESRLHICAIQS